MGLFSSTRRRAHSKIEALTAPTRVPLTAGVLALDVRLANGHPADAANITIAAQHTQAVVMRGQTDPFGTLTAGLPVGGYSITINKDGMMPISIPAKIDVGKRSVVEANLTSVDPITPPREGFWVFDPPHTGVRFAARHVGIGTVHGRFANFSGSAYISDNPENSHVEFSIEASSIDTGNRTRDRHLRSADFLDCEKYPHIQFVGSQFKRRGNAHWAINGSLSIRDVSRTVNLEMEYLGSLNGGYGEELRCAARATTELHREDYTLDWNNMLARGIAIVGPTIKIELDVQLMFRCDETPTPPD
ncbi:Polyisoprenoid-binding protein YceI [Streptomyces sp. SolWspMP-5a-2]|nr:hypothetical protein [Streptomyces sp. SID4950]SCE34826.1 Polyisoprenoid-binding protein YceI [Streptomyces sp. SolWspMP-5a-2]